MFLFISLKKIGSTSDEDKNKNLPESFDVFDDPMYADANGDAKNQSKESDTEERSKQQGAGGGLSQEDEDCNDDSDENESDQEVLSCSMVLNN